MPAGFNLVLINQVVCLQGCRQTGLGLNFNFQESSEANIPPQCILCLTASSKVNSLFLCTSVLSHGIRQTQVWERSSSHRAHLLSASCKDNRQTGWKKKTTITCFALCLLTRKWNTCKFQRFHITGRKDHACMCTSSMYTGIQDMLRKSPPPLSVGWCCAATMKS